MINTTKTATTRNCDNCGLSTRSGVLRGANLYCADCATANFPTLSMQPPEYDAGLRDNCSHNTMTDTGNLTHTWKCVDCGYIYGGVAQSDTGQPGREMPLLDFRIADNAEQPAILLTRAGDGLTLGVFPVEYEELVVKIVDRVNAHESLVAALEQSRETINELTWNRHIVGRTREKLSRVSEQCAEALKYAREGE